MMLLMTDSLMSLNLAIIERGIIYRERPKILKHYLKHSFLQDLIVLICLSICFNFLTPGIPRLKMIFPAIIIYVLRY